MVSKEGENKLSWYEYPFFIIGLINMLAWIITIVSYFAEGLEFQKPIKFFAYRRKVIFIWCGMLVTFFVLVAVVMPLYF